MNWVKPAFSDFLGPTKKRQRSEDTAEVDQGGDWNNQENKQEVTSTLNLLTKYFPKTRDELVVNKKKIEEVEYWLKNLENESTYLILTGPSGCGKFRTINVLCKILKIECVEWVTPLVHSYDAESANVFYQNELQIFEEFIIRACRYSSVLSSSSSKRIVLIKDIPNGYFRNTSSFHTFLENYDQVGRLHIVFIISDVAVFRSLFPEQIKFMFSIKIINFNPITQKNIATALNHLTRKFGLQKINPSIASHIDKISNDCNGDLRNAIASLHFILGDKNAKSSLPMQKKKKAKAFKGKTKSVSDNDSKTIPDNKIDIFQGLGRVLYAKRENGKLVYDPGEVADMFITSPQLFVGMLHENYLSTFSSIHDIAKASLSLVASDILLEDWNINSMLLGCGVSVASYGLMAGNSNPLRKFQQFNKPRSKFDTILSECKDLLESSHPPWKGTDILMDIAPYALNIPYFNSPHKELINKLKNFHIS